jgi:hypothetical protein
LRRGDASQLKNLAKLTALEILGFLAFELAVWILVTARVIPPQLSLSQVGVVELTINSAYIVIAGLFAVLVASFWLALLAETGIVRISEIDVSFLK